MKYSYAHVLFCIFLLSGCGKDASLSSLSPTSGEEEREAASLAALMESEGEVLPDSDSEEIQGRSIRGYANTDIFFGSNGKSRECAAWNLTFTSDSGLLLLKRTRKTENKTDSIVGSGATRIVARTITYGLKDGMRVSAPAGSSINVSGTVSLCGGRSYNINGNLRSGGFSIINSGLSNRYIVSY